jgi:hypothetical protein
VAGKTQPLKGDAAKPALRLAPVRLAPSQSPGQAIIVSGSRASNGSNTGSMKVILALVAGNEKSVSLYFFAK